MDELSKKTDSGDKMRTISIKGTGKAKRDPDLVIFDISTSAQSEVYADSVVESNRLVNKLKQAFEDMGFNKDDLKTVNYHTRPVYEYVEVGVVNKRSKRELECFEVSHDLKIEFDLDNDKINEVLNCLKDFRNGVDFNIRFSVNDKDSMKSTWNQNMVIYQTINELSQKGFYDNSGLTMNQFLVIREILANEDILA